MNHSMLFDFFNRCMYNFGLLKKTSFLKREDGQNSHPLQDKVQVL